jgi:diphthamide biosynthesis protein 7
MTSIHSLTSFKLDLSPSCIEFFPLKPEFAVIGTYNLEKQTEEETSEIVPEKELSKTQQRNGSLILVRVDGNNVYVHPRCSSLKSLPIAFTLLKEA